MPTTRLHNCPHTDKIVCDTKYSVRETNRQAMETSGQYVEKLFHYTPECHCDPQKCKRFLDKMKQLAQQKKK